MLASAIDCTIDVIRDEARHLVHQGLVSRNQAIYTLCNHIPAREWVRAEAELEAAGFLLRDRIGDLMGREDWDND